jgi:three-Cys-motif partner protein
MSDFETPPIRDWSRDKLDVLAKYLAAYATIMSRQKETWLRGFAYIDAFAGPGVFDDPETKALVDGSPVRAITCNPAFDKLWFIDQSATRIDQLRRLAIEHQSTDIRFRRGDANEILEQEICREITYASYWRAFVFLDPYGLQVKRSTIDMLGHARCFDVFINFPIMAVNR